MSLSLLCLEDNFYLLERGSPWCPAQDQQRPPVKRRVHVVLEGGIQKTCFLLHSKHLGLQAQGHVFEPTPVRPAEQKLNLRLGRMRDFEGQKGAWGGLGLQMYLE